MTNLDIQQPALLAALEQALNHPPPFSAAECRSFTGPLRIQHARDLAELQYCPALRQLEIFASDIPELGVLAHLPQLSTLIIRCSRVNQVHALANCRKLEHVDISFTDVHDLAPLLCLPQLQRGVLLGNPWTPESYNTLRPRLLARNSGSTNTRPLLEFSRRSDWMFTQELWRRGLPLCFSYLDLDRGVIVKPGLPTYTRGRCDFLAEPIEVVLHQLNQKDIRAVEDIFAQFLTAEERQATTRSFDFVSHRTLGHQRDALKWIEQARLSVAEKDNLRLFVQRFPDLLFYKEDAATIRHLGQLLGVDIPQWFVDSLATLTSVAPNQTVWLQFDPESLENVNEQLRYRLNLLESGDRNRFIANNERMRPVVIASSNGTSLLAINEADPQDRQIYQYDLEDLGDPIYDSLSQQLFVMFSSYSDMLRHTLALEIQD